MSDTLGPTVRLDPARATWQGAQLRPGLTAYFSGGVRLEFNRSFSKSQSGKHRSYSVTLRPDILVETPRERHIFDAKFAFEPLGSSLSDDDEDDEDEGNAGRARRWHIHKMHTYRDALDRVASVRVLYPGSIEEWHPDGPHGARQGVGSLPLRVDKPENLSALSALLRDLIQPAGVAAGDVLAAEENASPSP